MEEQNNQNLEPKALEVTAEENFIEKVKKFFSKKTNLIASIVAGVAIIATIVCLIIFGQSPEEKEILGEWYCTDFNNMCVKFSDDKTGELHYGSTIMDFEWEYDKENKNYRTNIGGYRTTFEFRTEEGITFLKSNTYGYFFKEEDCDTALDKADALRNNIIDNALKDKKLITIGQTISEGDFSIVLNSIQMSELVYYRQASITCNITITANRDLTSNELNELINYDRYYYVAMNFVPMSETMNSKEKLSDTGLAKGETLNVDFSFSFVNSDLESTIHEWGVFHGYAVFIIGETEYRLDLREYTKQ